LARALDLHSRGQGFDSLILHEDGDGRRERQSAESGAQSGKSKAQRAERQEQGAKRRKKKRKKMLKRRAEAKKQKVQNILKDQARAERSQE
jgi:hypothetical protein